MRLIFFGTSEFAIPILKALVSASGGDVSLVVTQPDQPVGRKKILTPPPVKKWLKQYAPQISILQPEKLDKTFNFQLLTFNCDIAIVAAYGKIIPQEILDIPKHGFLNIHPSLLPKYRGPSPIQTAILNGDKETGVTIIKMDEKIDHGAIFASSKLKVKSEKFRYKELESKLAELGARLLIETLPKYLTGEIKPQPQDHSQATFTKLLKREDGQINWQKSAEEIERMVRAYDPWPGTFAKFSIMGRSNLPGRFDLQTLKILKARILHPKIGCAKNPNPGALFTTEQGDLAVNCNPGSLVLEQVQPEGKRKMSGKEFLTGHKELIRQTLI